MQLKDALALVIIDVSHRYRQLIEARKELEAATALQSAARQWEALCYAQIGGLTLATAVTLFIVPVLYSIFVLDMKIIRWEESVAKAGGSGGGCPAGRDDDCGSTRIINRQPY